jgi:hypothetical protein
MRSSAPSLPRSVERITGSAFSEADFEWAEALYGMLYLRKCTALNPQYSATFLRDMAAAGLLGLVGFREPKGDLLCFAGMFRQGSQLVCPVPGHDTTTPPGEGLYRIPSAKVSTRAEQGLLNRSTGAASSRSLQGMVPALEHVAVIDRYLPWKRRAAGWLVQSLLTSVAVPLVRRYRL